MKLAFYFTLACTARCDHCITFAGPKVTRKMPLDAALDVVAQAARLSAIDGIVFTGGENFVHAEELLRLVRACTASGLSSEVISNAFWARNAEAARAMLAPFREAGLGTLRVSIDRWHLPYVSIDRVHTALEAAGALGFERHVTCVVEQHNAVYKRSRLAELVGENLGLLREADTSPRPLLRALRTAWPPELVALLEQYRFDLDRCVLIDDAIELRDRDREWPRGAEVAARLVRNCDLVQFQFLATEGRGRGLIGDVGDKPVDQIPDTVCNSVGFTPVVNPEGDVFPCCSSWVNFPRHRMGNLAESDLPSLLEKVSEDLVARFMHYQGPAVLVKFLRARGWALGPGPPPGFVPLDQLKRRPPDADPLPERYTHPCHLCGTLLERFSHEDLEAHIRAFYAENPWRELFPIRGFDLLASGDAPIF
jgi:hypothetical protein